MEILSGLSKGKKLISFAKGGPFQKRLRKTSPLSGKKKKTIIASYYCKFKVPIQYSCPLYLSCI